MKNRIFLAAMIIGLLAASCKKETPEPQQGELMQMPITITASYKTDNDAKVDYTENGNTISATWETGDQILVAYDGYVSALTLSSGAGTSTATFSGTISYTHTPSANSILSCYVQDKNNTDAIVDNGNGTISYAVDYLTQDGTVAGAGKCNTYFGMATYGTGSNINCTFSVSTSILKFRCFAPDGVSAGAEATLTYKSGSTELAKATFTVGATNGENTVYLAVPAGAYSGAQTLVYTSGTTEVTKTLSADHANFAVGQTYSKTYFFGSVNLGVLDFDYTAQHGDVLTGTLASSHKITIAAGATVTLNDATINLTANNTGDDQPNGYAALTCLGNATILLADGTTNIVNPLYYLWPSIQPGPAGSTLTIDGTGTLNATAANTSSGAGTLIGGGYNTPCGNIVIAGGTINASQNATGIAIGAGYGNVNNTDIAPCGNITITGGSVTAITNNGYTAIGTAQYGNCGDITITGGTVVAKVGSQGGACIGACSGRTCGKITISGGDVTATYKTSVASYQNLVGIGAGIGSNGNASVCGDILINGGNVEATVTSGSNSGTSPAIGCAQTSSSYTPNRCGDITITSPAHVTATRGTKTASPAPDRTIGKNTGSSQSTVGAITIGGTMYYDGLAYLNGGETYLQTSPLEYPAPAPTEATVTWINSHIQTIILGSGEGEYYQGIGVQLDDDFGESYWYGTDIYLKEMAMLTFQINSEGEYALYDIKKIEIYYSSYSGNLPEGGGWSNDGSKLIWDDGLTGSVQLWHEGYDPDHMSITVTQIVFTLEKTGK